MSNFIPKPEHIRDKVYCGTFYQRPSSSPAINVAEISRVCYDMRSERCPGLTATKTADVVWRIANSAWNRAHFQYAMTGVQNYATYGFAGPQYGKVGGAFPLLWIPGPNGEEPEQMFGPAPLIGGIVTPKPTDPGMAVLMPGTGTQTSRVGSGAKSGAGIETGTLIGNGGGGAGSRTTGGGTQLATFIGAGTGGFPWWLLLLGLAAGGGIWWATRKKGAKGSSKRGKRGKR